MITELLPGVFYTEPDKVFPDARGSFAETFHRRELEEKLGHPWLHVQENTSESKEGVARGIHVAPWNKFTQVAEGEVQAVIVDARRGSPTIGQHCSVILSAENKRRLWVPAGCGNSFKTMSDFARYQYLVDADYQSCAKIGIGEKGISILDPELGIKWQWGLDSTLLSPKDREENPTFSDYLKQGYGSTIYYWQRSLDLRRVEVLHEMALKMESSLYYPPDK